MRRYPSKILLFGEYILLLGQRALAVPAPAFSGRWAHGAAPEAGESLMAFAQSDVLALAGAIDTARFGRELAAGLFFESDIPIGYGLGSSGALCAAVYDRFAFRKTPDTGALQAIFSAMENYFHGQSSGIDPLTSYLNRALWVSNRRKVRFFQPPVWQSPEPVVFLLDTALPRQTGPLVQWFMEQSQKPAFARLLERDLFPAHAAMLEAWEKGVDTEFREALRQVSAFQLAHMHPMIPEHLRGLWSGCLDADALTLKICGAGGGGFMLGFAKSKMAAQRYLSDFTLIFPFEPDAMVEK